MTNATTGGGNGAAPVGTGGAAPAPERLLPTRPGWWWRGAGHNGIVERVIVTDDGRLMYADGLIGVRDDGRWLAEVPPPEVCAAWAATGCPSAAVLEALGEWSARVFSWEDAGGRQAGGGGHSGRFAALSDAVLDAEESLLDAIRAERAAQGSAPDGAGEVQP